MNRIDPILLKVGPAECLAVLAEEATELAQAALKMRRTMDSVKDKNPTNMPTGEVFHNVIEEIADVQTAWFVLFSPRLQEVTYEVNKIIDQKHDRWAKRICLELKEKHDEDEDEEEEEEDYTLCSAELYKAIGISQQNFHSKYMMYEDVQNYVNKHRKKVGFTYMYNKSVVQWFWKRFPYLHPSVCRKGGK